MEGPVSARLDSMTSCSHRCYGDSHSTTLPMRKRLRLCNPRQSYGQQLETAFRTPTLSALRALPPGMQQKSVFLASICSSSWCQPAWSHQQSQRSPTVIARVAAPERAQVRCLIRANTHILRRICESCSAFFTAQKYIFQDSIWL